MTDIVTLTNLTKTYNGIPALRDVTMSIPSGKIIGLLGTNGTGKTCSYHLVVEHLTKQFFDRFAMGLTNIISITLKFNLTVL